MIKPKICRPGPTGLWAGYAPVFPFFFLHCTLVLNINSYYFYDLKGLKKFKTKYKLPIDSHFHYQECLFSSMYGAVDVCAFLFFPVYSTSFLRVGLKRADR